MGWLLRSSMVLLLAALFGCTLDRGGLGDACTTSSGCAEGEVCRDRLCVVIGDAGILDGSADTGAFDAPIPDGPPPHCSDGILNGTETALDCGGSCPGCQQCSGCNRDEDCIGRVCIEGKCAPELAAVESADRGVLNAFVDLSGRILLAHYAPGHFQAAFNPHVAQVFDRDGGSIAGIGWAPDPCTRFGHLDYDAFEGTSRTVVMECGPSELPEYSVSSASLFRSFQDGHYGVAGAAGVPGWAVIAAVGSGSGRGSTGACGLANYPDVGGIAYCDGAAADFSSHLVSYYSSSGPESPIIGCNRAGCSGSECELHVWVWLE